MCRWYSYAGRAQGLLWSTAMLLALGAISDTARAEQLVFRLNKQFTSNNIVEPPYLTATFDDEGSPGSVRLTLEATNLGQEFVREWDFNLNPDLDPNDLQFSVVSKTGTFADPDISTGEDDFQADGDGLFDIEVLFDNSPPANRFEAGESIVLDITGISTLKASDFNFFSTPKGGQGVFPTAAQIVGGPNAGWVTVPEPSSCAIALMGAALLLARARRGRGKDATIA